MSPVETQSISVEEADDIIDGRPVAIQHVSKHRWYTRQLVVFERDGEMLGFHYLEPATEEQEGQDVYEGDPVPVFPVISKQITTTEWVVA